MIVINEDRKIPSEYGIALRRYRPSHQTQSLTIGRVLFLLSSLLDALTIINLPVGPTAYFKLTSIELSKQISVRFRRPYCVAL